MQLSLKAREYLLVGVTGGIGSGKSVVCELLAQLGRCVLSADAVARSLTESDSQVKESIRSTFGIEVFHSNGELDRKKLAEMVFSDERLRKRLNKIVHPKVFSSLQHHVDSLLPHQRLPYVVIEAALIYETGLHKNLDYVIVVDAREKSRISRVMKRDGITRREVLSRMNSQLPSSRKIGMADFAIHNNGKISELYSRVKLIDRILTAVISSKRPRKFSS